jgi:ribulose-5-phosphate 4-epimerase/fuculose-1-phosphate aldolase
VHPPYGTALAALADPTLLPIDQVTAKFYNRVAIDTEFGGIADFADEGARLVRALGSYRHMIMGNHGVLCTGATVAETFDELYFLERAARTLVLAYSTGRPLKVLSPDVAEKTALGWEDYGQAALCHFAELKRGLDRRDASYAT